MTETPYVQHIAFNPGELIQESEQIIAFVYKGSPRLLVNTASPSKGTNSTIHYQD